MASLAGGHFAELRWSGADYFFFFGAAFLVAFLAAFFVAMVPPFGRSPLKRVDPDLWPKLLE
jgi:hypothetical protein